MQDKLKGDLNDLQYFALAAVVHNDNKMENEKEIMRWKTLLSILRPDARGDIITSKSDVSHVETSIPENYMPIQQNIMIKEQILNDLRNLGVAVIDDSVSDL